MSIQRLLNISQVTRLSGLNRKTIEKRIASGAIGSVVDAVSGRTMVDVNELLRCFPNISANDIERELNGGGQITGTTSSVTSPPNDDGVVADLKGQVARLEMEVVYLKKLVGIYEQDLQAARERETSLMTLVNRMTAGLPAPASKKSMAAQNQARDERGKFTSSGKSATKSRQASLLPMDGGDDNSSPA